MLHNHQLTSNLVFRTIDHLIHTHNERHTLYINECPEDDDHVCGFSYDHTITDYHVVDGIEQWTCDECGAEGWRELDDDEIADYNERNGLS